MTTTPALTAPMQSQPPHSLHRRNTADTATISAHPQLPTPPIQAVLFDRDGTLIVDIAYNTDPKLVHPLPHAQATIAALRKCGIRIGVVTNQSGINRGFMTWGDVAAVNKRVDELLGPFEHWGICPHRPDQQCRCRKPEPGLIREACENLGIPPQSTVVIGDIGSDIGAAHAAGTHAILVPTMATRAEEIDAAPLVASNLHEALTYLPLLPKVAEKRDSQSTEPTQTPAQTLEGQR